MTRNSQHRTQKPSAWYALGLKTKEHLMRIEDQFLDWNTKIMSMMNMKEGTKLETLIKKYFRRIKKT